jgi:hypothetical protein
MARSSVWLWELSSSPTACQQKDREAVRFSCSTSVRNHVWKLLSMLLEYLLCEVS